MLLHKNEIADNKTMPASTSRIPAGMVAKFIPTIKRKDGGANTIKCVTWEEVNDNYKRNQKKK